METRYQWNADKAASNLAKHGIAFSEAIEIFASKTLLVVSAFREEDREHRWKAIGRLGARLITIVFVERDNGRRIISARPANATEARIYAHGPL